VTPDQEHVAQLYRRVGPTIYRRCLRILKSREAAQDATQEVFLKILNSPHRFQADDALLPIIYKTATHHCLNMVRDTARRDQKHVTYAFASAASSDNYPDRQLSQQVLSRFDLKTQAIAVGVLVDGMEQAELASALGLSSKTISRKLTRFLTNARKFIQRTDS
jgi:RNA polymerase sigma-70 factor (ECF subfamily)